MEGESLLGPDDLLVTGSTLGHPPFRELVEAAAAGSFAGLSLWPQTSYRPALESGLRPPELRSMLDANGLVVNDVDVLPCWVGEGTAPSGGPGEAELFEAGESLGARFLNVVMMSDARPSTDAMAELFAGIVDRAAEHGLTAHLEFVPFMAVPDAATAWRVVEQAGRPKSGVMVDSWHCFRGPTRSEDLRAIPGERVLGVQINDAPAEPMENPVEETLHHRRVPGDGDIDLVALLRLLSEIGCPAPLTVEVFSDALLQRGTAAEIARLVGDATRAVRARARETG